MAGEERMNKNITTILTSAALLLILAFPAGASIWGTSATGSLTGSRSVGNGLTSTGNWGSFVINWNITQSAGLWTYKYTLIPGSKPGLSHWILEVTETSFSLDAPTTIEYSPIEGPENWSTNGNPGLPTSFFGIKFDEIDDDYAVDGKYSFTITTANAPVWGVFYAKGGRNSAAWSNALNFADYKTNIDLNDINFIVRPNGAPVPVPGALLLLGSGLVAVLGLRSRQNR